VPDEEDLDEIDSVSRCLATKTTGAFVRKKVSADELKTLNDTERIIKYRTQLNKQLRKPAKRAGAVKVNSTGHSLWAIAVRYMAIGRLRERCEMKGEPRWVEAKCLLETLVGKSTSSIPNLSVPEYQPDSAQPNSAEPQSLTLYLPFVAVLRSEGALRTIRALAKHTTQTTLPKVPQKPKALPCDEEKNDDSKSKMNMKAFATNYACRKCRRTVFSSNDVIEGHDSDERSCTSHFLSEEANIPLIKQIFNVNSGKLTCPNLKCKSRLGEFNWAGSKCSCGKFVSPAFQISRAKVEPKLRLVL